VLHAESVEITHYGLEHACCRPGAERAAAVGWTAQRNAPAASDCSVPPFSGSGGLPPQPASATGDDGGDEAEREHGQTYRGVRQHIPDGMA
jgi:hypothetical protein